MFGLLVSLTYSLPSLFNGEGVPLIHISIIVSSSFFYIIAVLIVSHNKKIATVEKLTLLIIVLINSVLFSVVDQDSIWIRIQQLCESGSVFRVRIQIHTVKKGKNTGLTSDNNSKLYHRNIFVLTI